MENVRHKILNRDWEKIADAMDQKGFALLQNILSKEQYENLIIEYENHNHYRKTIVMERYRFGSGEYKYFNYPLPNLIQNIRETIYSKL
jgi:uncharacterized protein